MLDGLDNKKQRAVMKSKMHEELKEFYDALDEFDNADAESRAAIGKAREHALEEGVDAMTAIYTTLRQFATHSEIQREAGKVIIKNSLRGYLDAEIPF